MPTVRAAHIGDAEAMLSIYRPYILESAISFETEIPAHSAFAERIKKYMQQFPWLVCEIEGGLAAYVYASPHRDREAYQWTCECSVYVDEMFKGRGVAQPLYAALFRLLQEQGYRNVYAGITQPNPQSEAFHARCGFQAFALYEKVGFKFEEWHDVRWWKLRLNDYSAEPVPPLSYAELPPILVSQILDEAAVKIRSAL